MNAKVGVRPQYAMKCDECKKEIRRTDSLRESAAGGGCEECRAKR